MNRPERGESPASVRGVDARTGRLRKRRDRDPDPPAPRRSLPDSTRPRRAAGPRLTFGAAVGWSVFSTLVPGSGLVPTRHRILGALLLTTSLVLLVGVGGAALTSPERLLSLAVTPGVLTAAWIILAVFGVLWAASIVATHLVWRPTPAAGWQRVLGSLLVGVLTLAVTTASFMGARMALDTSTMLNAVLGDAPAGGPPSPASWNTTGRVNVLILGGDSGQSRSEELGARTDTVMVASIDTRTGDTVLFSLPRQTQRMPFPVTSALHQRWPDGFTNGRANDSEYFLNSMYHNVPVMAPELMPASAEDPGAQVLKASVGEALGLPIHYYAMINMDGFIEFINALGGITVNINHPIPVGGNTSRNIPPDRWLPPGPDQHLNGWDALWFARGRYGEETGDYARMARQRCVVQAVVQQADPGRVAANYEALTKASSNIIATDVPNRDVAALLPLALRVKDGTMTSIAFVNDEDGFSTVRPDWDLVRQRVQRAINPPPPPAPAPAPSSTRATATPTRPSPRPSATQTASPAPTPPPAPASVADECAYNPEPWPKP